MRSGIGPGADLQGLGVPVVADLPGVGGNLQEHGGSGAACRLTAPTYNQQTGPLDMLSHLVRFALFRRGPLTSTAVQALAYFKSDPALAEPDFLFSFIPLAIDYNAKPPKMHDFPGIGVGINLCKPDGRGRIRLRDASPDAKPIIDHQVLGNDNDVRRIVIALKITEKLFQTEAFRPFVAEQLAPPPGPKSDEDYVAYARSAAGTAYHPVGTCRMGVGADAVVDPRLRVRGVQSLRVVDASIMPRITSGNTNAPAIMIGERAADLILEDRRG
jgi:choline dehydrogenase